MTPSYRYLLCDLLTDQLLADVPLTGVSFDRRISRVGSLQGQLVAPTQQLAGMARVMHSYAGRSALWVFRDGQLWWGGIPWTVRASQGARGAITCQVTAATFDSYAHHRDLPADVTYTQADQGVILPDLWRRLQGDPRGNIGMVAEDQLTGVLRDRAYRVSDGTKVGELIEQLGDVIDGPEHTVDVYLDSNGARVKRLRVADRLGQADPRTVFQRAARAGGRIVQWDHTADAVDGGTVFRARGDANSSNVGAETEPQLSPAVYRNDLLADGWPLLDVMADYSGVSDPATLAGHAEALAATNGGALPTSAYSVEVGNTGWSPNRVGDAVRLKLRDLWHDTDTDLTVRPVGCTVTAPTGTEAEQVQLLLADED